MTPIPTDEQTDFFDRSLLAAKKVREKFGDKPLAYTQVAHTLNQAVAAAQAKDFKIAEAKLKIVNEWIDDDAI